MTPRTYEEAGNSFAYLGLSHYEQLEQKARVWKQAQVDSSMKRLKGLGATVGELDTAYRAREGDVVTDYDVGQYLSTKTGVEAALRCSLELAGCTDEAKQTEVISTYYFHDAQNLAMKLLGMRMRVKFWPDGKGVDDPKQPKPPVDSSEGQSSDETSTSPSSGA